MDNDLEGFVIFVGTLLDVHDHVAVHLDKAAVAIPGEAVVAGGAGEGEDGFVVEAEVEDGVHHAGHGVACAGADGDEERQFCFVAELAAHDFFHVGDGGFGLGFKVFGVGLFVFVVVGADFGGDGEAWRNGESDAGHFGEAGAFAAEEVPPGALAFCFACSESVDPLGHFVCPRCSICVVPV